MFFPVTGFYQFPTVTSGFQILFWTQNPPLATAYRFESGHRHQKREPRPGFSFLVFRGGRTRTYPNATVRWTVATRRFRRVLHSALASGCWHHCPKSLVFQGLWAFSAGQSRIEAQHTGRSQRVRGNGVPAVTVHRGLCQKRQTTDHHRPAV